MQWVEGFIAADWGTTNRRAYLIDGAGKCVDEFEDEKGILAVPAEGFETAVGEIRQRLGDHPLLLAGMVGSNRGWVEAPYVRCPAGLADLAAALVWVERGRTAVVPGLRCAPRGAADVMRGEEVQLFGAAAAGLIPSSCLVCHPGTHNKWVELEDGRITSFRTVMTGEMFNILREASILSDLLREPVKAGFNFRRGVDLGYENDALTTQLFTVRARVLLGSLAVEKASSVVSGLLIGSDVRSGLQGTEHSEVYIMGRPELTALYAQAIDGIACRIAHQIDGEQAFLAGAKAIVELIA